jgi:hypothetical protein
MQNQTAPTDLLQRCTARILANGGASTGTGFFVAPGYLLTCAHVVATSNPAQTSVEAIWNDQNYSATFVGVTSTEYPDLALLQIANPPDHPCVYLYTDASPEDSLYTYGYPDNYPKGDPATFTCEGLTGGNNVLIKFKSGEVRRGFSGSPLLNQRTGAVCGVVKLTRGTGTILGGRAIPVARAIQEFSLLQDLQKQFHSQDEQWAKSLTLQQRQANGFDKLHPLAENEAIEIFFSYDDNEQDLKIFHQLEKQLTLLRRKGVIDAWHTGKLAASEDVKEETLKHLDSARIICLLVSPDYIADDKLYESHVTRAMERRKNEGTIVIPILLRPTDDWEETSFGTLLAIPRNRKPMSRWSDLDDVSMQVAREIRVVVENLKKPKP